MQSSVEIRRATAADVHAFFEGAPYHSCRAVVAVKDGKPIGIGGVSRVGSQMVVFTDFPIDGSISKKDIVRAARMVEEIIDEYTAVVAYSSAEVEKAKVFANHFGFKTTNVVTPDGELLVRVRNGTT